MELSAQALTKLMKEFKDLRQEPIDGVAVSTPAGGGMLPSCNVRWQLSIARRLPQVIMNEDNLADIQADYEGPCECRCSAGHSCLAAAPPRRRTRARPGSAGSARRLGPRLQDIELSRLSSPLSPARRAAGTPFEDGVFRMKLIIGADFPQSPPKGACAGRRLLAAAAARTRQRPCTQHLHSRTHAPEPVRTASQRAPSLSQGIL